MQISAGKTISDEVITGFDVSAIQGCVYFIVTIVINIPFLIVVAGSNRLNKYIAQGG